MKNILVPTDFSTCASYATELGIALAEFFGATLHLFTSMDNSQQNGAYLDCTLDEQSIEGKAFLENANVLFEKWKKEAKYRRIQVKSICASGKLLPGLEAYVAKNDIDFIVMGSHGVSGLNEMFMGSNTQKVVRAMHVPVFVVKKPLQNYEFKNVVFASSFVESEKESFVEFLDFIKKFKPEKIHLVGINTAGWFGMDSLRMERSMVEFQGLCPISKCVTHLVNDVSIEEGIRHFAEEINADLIAISNHNRHPLKRIFSGSNVEALVNHSDLPVLSIDFEKHKNIKEVEYRTRMTNLKIKKF